MTFAAAFFAVTNDPAAKSRMIGALGHRRPEIRVEAVDAVRFYCDRKEAAGHLVAALKDPSKPVVVAALGHMSFLPADTPARAITPLLEHADPEIRESAAGALECSGDPDAVDPLLKATKDPDPRVRARAAVSLGRIAAPRAYGRLVAMLADQDARVRLEAANGLRWLGDRRAIAALEALLQREKDEDARAMATRAIRELNRRP